MMTEMLRFLGSMLILLGSIGNGWVLVASGRGRLANMQSVLYRLVRMNGEISFGRFDLTQVCRQCAGQDCDAFARALKQVADRMEKNLGEEFSFIWKEEVGTLLVKETVPEDFRNCLLELGDRVGMMDAQLSRQMLRETCTQLEQIMQHYREQLEDQNRVKVGLSIGAGMMMVLLLW